MVKMIREDIDWHTVKDEFRNARPFNHVVIDNFFLPDVAEKLSNEFPDYDDPMLGFYNNAIENKKVFNKWDRFPKLTYQAFTYLAREEFLDKMRFVLDDARLWMDVGLNGGGWHLHSRGGNNNVHLDYNIHPKLGEQRKLNIIIYMTPNWDPSWGGGLELWTHDDNTHRPKDMVKLVDNVYNRAVIFDTTQNSWHGLPKHITCPEGVVRKSLAAYYVRPAPANADPRGKALFAPTEEQKGNPEIEELIRQRSNVETAEKFHKGQN
ncbi:2OG-Fe(II) oxygenase [bacterium]|nr:2OG-Fe(II) oxygenase [bacterium]